MAAEPLLPLKQFLILWPENHICHIDPVEILPGNFLCVFNSKLFQCVIEIDRVINIYLVEVIRVQGVALVINVLF